MNDTPQPQRGIRAAVRRLVAVAAAATVIATGATVAAPTPAYAASDGAGYWLDNGQHDSPLGSFLVGNTHVYCLELGVAHPVGRPTTSQGYAGFGSLSPDTLAKINWAVSTYGQTGDNNTAAAVAMYVWSLSDATEWNSNGGDGYYVYRAPASQRTAIRAILDTIRAEGSSITAAPASGSGSATLVLDVDSRNHYNGTLNVSLTPTNATGTVTLTNGVFTATGTPTMSGITHGGVYNVRGVAPDDSGASYKIEATGEFRVASGYRGNVELFHTPGAQYTAGPGEPNSYTFSGHEWDPSDRSVMFQPVVTTTADAFVTKGERFVDTVMFATAANDEGVNNDWFVSDAGNYAPVTARGTVYGPFASQPEESATVPADAPIAGTATLTTDLATGPTVSYRAETDEVATQGGFYTWVWTIDWNDQVAGAQRLIPGPSVGNEDLEPYFFADAFGQVVESSVVAADITAVSRVTSATVALGAEAQDTLRVSTEDMWPMVKNADDELVNVPVTFRGTAYHYPGAEAPEVTDTVPAEAVLIDTVMLDVAAPGDYTPDSVTVPTVTDGFVVWVWEILDADQPAEYRGMVSEWHDSFGLADETQRIELPSVTTQAIAGINLGEQAYDIANVTGPVPVGGSQLTFAAYKVPMVAGEDGIEHIAYPEGVEPGDLTWVCAVENLVFDTNDAPIEVTEPGSYQSDSFTPDDYGMYLWVETLTDNAGTFILRGECGEPNETTYVIDVTTRAWTEAGVQAEVSDNGAKVWDTAEVIGYVPTGATISFEAYRGKTITEACTAEAVWVSPEQELAEGLYREPLAVTGAAWETTALSYDTTLYWVEVTRDELGREISRGECGDPNETAGLKGSMVLSAGSDIAPVVGGGIAVLVLAAGALLFASRRRKAGEEA